MTFMPMALPSSCGSGQAVQRTSTTPVSYTHLPWFRRMAALGMAGADADALQAAGLEAEAAMFRATDGVNTHKGALFSFAVLLSSLGRCLTAVSYTHLDVYKRQR